MPADASGVAQVTGTREIGPQSFDQCKCRCLRIGHHGNAADIAVRGRDVNGATEMLDPLSCLIHVADGDIPHPPRPRTHLQRLLRQTHKSAHGSMPGRKQYVGEFCRGRVLPAPAYDTAVKCFRGCNVCRQQFVPDETSGLIGHADFSTRPNGPILMFASSFGERSRDG